MLQKNVGVQIEGTVEADSVCLAQPVVPLSRESLQQCQDTEGKLRMIFQLSP